MAFGLAAFCAGFFTLSGANAIDATIDTPKQSRVVSGTAEYHSVPVSNYFDLVALPIYINGKGPYKFVLDTGATRTVLYSHVASELEIVQNGQDTTIVHGIENSKERPELVATDFSFGNLALGKINPVHITLCQWHHRRQCSECYV